MIAMSGPELAVTLACWFGIGIMLIVAWLIYEIRTGRFPDDRDLNPHGLTAEKYVWCMLLIGSWFAPIVLAAAVVRLVALIIAKIAMMAFGLLGDREES
jgi:hypothetical protein